MGEENDIQAADGGAQKVAAPGYPNLLPFSEGEARARELGRKGGLRSAEVRRRRKTMAEALDEYLSASLQPSHPRYSEIKRMLRTMGLLGDGEEPDNQMLLLAGMMQRAQKDPMAAAFIRDTVGERPTENIAASIDAPPPIVIGVHDAAWLARERERNERMAAEIRRTAVEVPVVDGEAYAAGRARTGQGALGTEADTSVVQGARSDSGGSRPAICASGEEPAKPKPPEPPKPAPKPKPAPPLPPPRPIDPNVCLPSATPPM